MNTTADQLSVVVNCGLGDNILSRLLLEGMKDKYNKINVCQDYHVLELYRQSDQSYRDFLKQIGEMIFDQPPFSYGGMKAKISSDTGEFDLVKLLSINNIQSITRPNLDYYCLGTPLEIGKYIVITTKVRVLEKNNFLPLLEQFLPILNQIPYKIVLLGERVVEYSMEYKPYENYIYSIYDIIKNKILPDKLIDLTIPALGISIPNATQIRQDLLIKRNAEKNFVFGEGGNFWMSLAVGNTFGYKKGSNDDPVDQMIQFFSHENYHPGTFITNNWQQFLERSKSWIQSAV